MTRVIGNDALHLRNGVLRVSRVSGLVPPVSAAGGADVYYDPATDQLLLSVNGSDWGPLEATPSAILTSESYQLPTDGTTDAASLLQTLLSDAAAAVASGRLATVVVGPGEYLVVLDLGPIVVPPGVSMICHEGAVFTKDGAHTGFMVHARGSVTATTSLLTSNGTEGASTVAVENGALFTAGDYLRIADSTFHLAGSVAANEEINRIVSTSGNTLTLRHPLVGSYATVSAAAVTRITPYRGRIAGGEFVIPQGTQGGGLQLELAYEARVDNVTVRGGDNKPCFEIYRSRGTVVSGCRAYDGQNQGTSGRAYGFQATESCFDIAFADCRGANLRENVINNRSREVSFINCTFEDCSDSGINTHYSLNSGTLIQGCTIRGGTVGILAGFTSGTLGADRAVTIQGNRIYGCQSAGISAGANAAVGRGDGLQILGNQIEDCGRSVTNSAAILVSRWDDILIQGNRISGRSNALQRYGIQLVSCDRAQVQNNAIGDLTQASGTGIRWDDCNDLLIQANLLDDIQTPNFHGAGTNTGITIEGNVADDVTVTLQGTERLRENRYGTKFDTNSGQAAAVADGGTITHNLRATPTRVNLTGTVAGEIVTLTSVSSTLLTVAIKTGAGAAGTTQTVHWEAGV